jgi:hypothetical protein
MEHAIIIQYSVLAAAIIAGLAAIGAAIGDSIVTSHFLDGMARQPEMAGKLFTNMLISVGLIESMPIIAIVIAIVLVFANPFLG